MVRGRSSRARPETSLLEGPVRTCVGCRQRAAKRDLVRVTAGVDRDGRPAAVPDPTSTSPGRGAHLHPTTACFDLAVRRQALGRALRVPTGLSPAPVGEYVAGLTARAASQDSTSRTTDQDWSSSS